MTAIARESLRLLRKVKTLAAAVRLRPVMARVARKHSISFL